MNYYIHQAKAGITDSHIGPCGPIDASVVASIQFSREEAPRWLHCMEIEGIPCFFVTEEDIYERMRLDDPDDEEFWDDLNSNKYIKEFDGIPLGEYEEIFAGFDEHPDNPAIPLLRYVIALIRCDWVELDGLIALAGDGVPIGDEPIPISDVEKEYRGIDEEE